MRAISFPEKGRIEIIEVDEPGELKPGEARLRVHKSGICGTDYGGYLGKMPFFSYPRIPGHELGVEVLEVADDVTNVKVGDFCSVEPYINEGKSWACRNGKPNCCPTHQTYGVMCDGGWRPRINFRADKLHPIPENVTLEQAALIETLAIGCHCIERSQPQEGENVLIIGAGPIGLTAIVFAKLAAANVIVMDLAEDRLEFCEDKMGVKTVQFAGDGSELERITQITGGDKPSLIIDATGNAKAMVNAINYIENGGRMSYVGIAPDTTPLEFLHSAIHKPEMSIIPSRNALPHEFKRIISLISSGEIDTDPWITHRTTFDEVATDLPRFAETSTGLIKAVIDIPEA